MSGRNGGIGEEVRGMFVCAFESVRALENYPWLRIVGKPSCDPAPTDCSSSEPSFLLSFSYIFISLRKLLSALILSPDHTSVGAF